MNIRHLSHSIKRRTLVITVLVSLQFIAVVLAVWLCARHFPLFSALLRLLQMATALYILSREMNPSYKLAWITLLLFAPKTGAVIYLIGGKMGALRFIVRQNRVLHNNDTQSRQVLPPDETVPDDLSGSTFAPISSYLARCTKMPPHQNTKCEFFPSGGELFKSLCHELKNARRFIFMEYFIIASGALWDEIESILAERRRSGVRILLLYDDAGSINTLPENFSQRLKSLGIETIAFNRCSGHLNSAMNYRDHRKICVIDGNIGFCGGANIADEYINRLPRCGHWKDTGTMLRGDGVYNLTRLFLELWNLCSCQNLSPADFAPDEQCVCDGFVQPFGDSPLDELYVAESVCAMSALRAEKYIYITTPYLIPDHETISALCLAAMSGVDVRIITPGIPDKRYVHIVSRSHYSQLLRHGVKIYEYTPGFIHAKQLVCDDSFAMVGTANMDFRSFYLHYECAVCLFFCRAVSEVKRDIEETLKCCHEITQEDINSFGTLQKLGELVLRPFFPLF